jgi:hypothetical protein
MGGVRVIVWWATWAILGVALFILLASQQHAALARTDKVTLRLNIAGIIVWVFAAAVAIVVAV